MDAYADRKAPDGVFSDGWRKVRRGGRIKCAGQWFESRALIPFVGDLVHVQVDDYWMQSVVVSVGRIGCAKYLCHAEPISAVTGIL